jgi:glycerol-3-phosphate acyltransferase PlsY
MLYLLAFPIAYLVGALPTGYWLCRALFGTDITQHGSGNIGASNVGRTYGKNYFVLIFLLDAFKAYAVLAGAYFFCAPPTVMGLMPTLQLLAAAVLLGNAYSIFLGFRGGKGVASIIGIFAFLYPPIVVGLFIAVWLVLLGLTKRAFIGSLGAMACVLILHLWLHQQADVLFIGLLFVWLVWRHRDNIKKGV